VWRWLLAGNYRTEKSNQEINVGQSVPPVCQISHVNVIVVRRIMINVIEKDVKAQEEKKASPYGRTARCKGRLNV
jgi:hypothetical protein